MGEQIFVVVWQPDGAEAFKRHANDQPAGTTGEGQVEKAVCSTPERRLIGEFLLEKRFQPEEGDRNEQHERIDDGQRDGDDRHRLSLQIG